MFIYQLTEPSLYIELIELLDFDVIVQTGMWSAVFAFTEGTDAKSLIL